jgi:hypothetical protein
VSSVQAIAISIQLHNQTESQTTELTQIVLNRALIPSGAKADSGGDSQRAESLNLWRQVLGGHCHGYSDRIAGGF